MGSSGASAAQRSRQVPGGFGMEGGIPGYYAFFMGIQGTKLAVATLVNTQEGESSARA